MSGYCLPLTSASASPRKRNWVPIVTTSDGIPMYVTMAPLNTPHRAPTASAAAIPSSTLPVAFHAATKPTIPSDMIDGNDRSMSPATMTIVSGIAMIAKNGVVWANDE